MDEQRKSEILAATENDKEEVLALYKMQIGREFCPWTDAYPGEDTFDFDLSRDAIFVMKEDGKIVAAISVDFDENVEELSCWDRTLAPAAELARICVLPTLQNRGVARKMITYAFDVLRERGYKSVHGLVNRHNKKAIRSYAVFDFSVVGECNMYEQEFLCYEKAL